MRNRQKRILRHPLFEKLTGKLLLLLCLLGISFLALPAHTAHAETNITGATLGTPYNYSGASGDT